MIVFSAVTQERRQFMTTGSRHRCILAAIGMLVIGFCIWMAAAGWASSAVEAKLDGVWQIVEIDHVQPMYSRDFTVTDYWEFRKNGSTSIHFAIGSPMTSSAKSWSVKQNALTHWMSRDDPAATSVVSIDLSPPRKPGIAGTVTAIKQAVGLAESYVGTYELQWHSKDECSLEVTSGPAFAFQHQHVRLKRSDRPHTPQ